jgi:hypothetical protein
MTEDELANFNQPMFAPVAWAGAETGLGERTLAGAVRVDPGHTASVGFAHALALTYKDPDVLVGEVEPRDPD